MKKIPYFLHLYQNRRELVLLEWAYAALAVTSLIVAGLFALLNQPLGVGLLIIPLVSFIALTMNIVAWALVKLLIESLHPGLKVAPSEAEFSTSQITKAKASVVQDTKIKSSAAKTAKVKSSNSQSAKTATK